MHRNHILIMDLVPNCCSSESGKQLQTLLRKRFPADEIGVGNWILFEPKSMTRRAIRIQARGIRRHGLLSHRQDHRPL